MAVIVIEVFSTIPGVDETAFFARNDEVQEWSHAHRKGLLRRTTARNERAWLVLWAWVDRASVDAPVPDDAPSLDEFIDQSSYRSNSFDTIS